MDANGGGLWRVWNQGVVPVILRRTGRGERLRVRVPFAKDNAGWLRGDRRDWPEWNRDGRYWETPRAWFNDLVNRALDRFGRVYIVQPLNITERCAPACLHAQGHECECSCMGVNHGAGNDGSWFEVTETFAVRVRDRALACRLMVRR